MPQVQDILVGNTTTEYIYVYTWVSGTGFGTRLSGAPVTPTGAIGDISFGQDCVFYTQASTTIGPQAHTYTPNVGFGTKFSNVSPAFSNTGTAYNGLSATDKDVFASGAASPFIAAWPFSSSTGYGTKYPNPATALPSVAFDIEVTKENGNNDYFVAVANASTSSTAGVNLYYFYTGVGFGTKIANPATLPPTLGTGISYKRNGTGVMSYSATTSPHVAGYQLNSTGF